MSEITIGPLPVDRTVDLLRQLGTLFGFDIPPGQEPIRAERFARRFEYERSRCAFEDGELVGTLGSFSLDMIVPGARVPCGGTTNVTVRPDRRRRGILTQMMKAHLDEARQHGDFITALWASDSEIYGRFGYGVASLRAWTTVQRPYVGFHRLAPALAPVQFVDANTARRLAPIVFNQIDRPGMFARSDPWWDHRWHDEPEDRHGGLAFRYAVAGDLENPSGYIQYRTFPGNWESGHADQRIEVTEIFALTPEASAGLWSFVLNADLTAEIDSGLIPIDDPLFSLLAGPRRARARVSDQLYVRVVDPVKALEARRYSANGSLILRVSDRLGYAEGTFRLTSDSGKGTFASTTSEPDIEMDVEDLGSVYLGRARFRELAAAGRLKGSNESLARADAMFSWFPAPWCQEVF